MAFIYVNKSDLTINYEWPFTFNDILVNDDDLNHKIPFGYYDLMYHKIYFRQTWFS